MAPPFAANLADVRRRIAAAAARAGRPAGVVTLVGVGKTMPAARLREAIDAGLRDLGENKVQEARDKVPIVGPGARWHLVGHLQSNKANLAARLFDVVHSIDSVEILTRLEHGAAAAGRQVEALVQVDLALEPTKSGARQEDLESILAAAETCRAVRVRGLMVLPPFDLEPERTRVYFRRLRALLGEAAARHPGLDLKELSMGMTGDFEVAIEEGATLVRVGRALFGARGKTNDENVETT